MIVIGTMDWGSTIERGEFYCPHCNANKSYQRKISRPFLTLYFVPVLPIGGLREFVICRGCRQRFEPSVLAPVKAAELVRAADTHSDSFEHELLRLIALMIVEDDFVSDAEIDMGQRIYQGMVGRPLSRSDLERACREVITLRIKTARYVAIAGKGMTYDQKLMAVQAMFAVAGAEGQISSKRLQSLMDTQRALELDDVAFQTAIKDASSWVA